jgi:hypothetical protein
VAAASLVQFGASEVKQADPDQELKAAAMFHDARKHFGWYLAQRPEPPACRIDGFGIGLRASWWENDGAAAPDSCSLLMWAGDSDPHQLENLTVLTMHPRLGRDDHPTSRAATPVEAYYALEHRARPLSRRRDG